MNLNARHVPLRRKLVGGRILFVHLLMLVSGAGMLGIIQIPQLAAIGPIKYLAVVGYLVYLIPFAALELLPAIRDLRFHFGGKVGTGTPEYVDQNGVFVKVGWASSQ